MLLQILLAMASKLIDLDEPGADGANSGTQLQRFVAARPEVVSMPFLLWLADQEAKATGDIQQVGWFAVIVPVLWCALLDTDHTCACVNTTHLITPLITRQLQKLERICRSLVTARELQGACRFAF
jgi:hypothetical protein